MFPQPKAGKVRRRWRGQIPPRGMRAGLDAFQNTRVLHRSVLNTQPNGSKGEGSALPACTAADTPGQARGRAPTPPPSPSPAPPAGKLRHGGAPPRWHCPFACLRRGGEGLCFASCPVAAALPPRSDPGDIPPCPSPDSCGRGSLPARPSQPLARSEGNVTLRARERGHRGQAAAGPAATTAC